MSRTIYAVGFQSVDSDEACVGGCQWSTSPEEIARFIESERRNRSEVDFEYLHFEFDISEVPEGSDTEAITEWVDREIWERGYEGMVRRTVILGSKYPGAERRRIERGA